ncbi:hypothetical protein [Teredinibacter turnerae]|uniref:hypothetical protein n=1 Tax=Teredinibacter turnerae TaxID=2426 RepID=UPI000376D08D|nr:hypothetical protein [Teredinibacter turnerae]
MNKQTSEWSISYKQLGIIVGSFILGLIAALLISNSQAATQTNFTTTELIGFVLSVILSGASIVLAISAIALGKISEQSVIERSDESIRLQNEVFIKTTEALQRIEASTGVTEKRIEDIISGRVGDISHQVAEIASRHSRQSPAATKALEEEIRQSLIQQINSEGREERRALIAKKRKAKESMEEKYQKIHEKLLLGIGNLDGISIEKIGHGTLGDDEGDVFDGVFKKGEKRFAVSTFRPDVSISSIQSFVTSVAEQSIKQDISNVFFIFFSDEEFERESIDSLIEAKSVLKDELSEKLLFSEISFDKYNEGVEFVSSRL